MANRKIAVRTAATEGTWYDLLPRSTRLPTIGGILVMAVMLMGFGVWAIRHRLRALWSRRACSS